MRQIAFGADSQSILISTESYLFAGQVRRRSDAAMNILVHLRLAEQAARKNRHGVNGHTLVDRNQVRRERKLGDIELGILQKTLMPSLLRVELDILNVEIRMLDAPLKQRRMPIVGAQCQGNSWLWHDNDI